MVAAVARTIPARVALPELLIQADLSTAEGVKSIVADPQYLQRTFIRSTHFRKQADASGWRPTPCTAR